MSIINLGMILEGFISIQTSIMTIEVVFQNNADPQSIKGRLVSCNKLGKCLK